VPFCLAASPGSPAILACSSCCICTVPISNLTALVKRCLRWKPQTQLNCFAPICGNGLQGPSCQFVLHNSSGLQHTSNQAAPPSALHARSPDMLPAKIVQTCCAPTRKLCLDVLRSEAPIPVVVQSHDPPVRRMQRLLSDSPCLIREALLKSLDTFKEHRQGGLTHDSVNDLLHDNVAKELQGVHPSWPSFQHSMHRQSTSPCSPGSPCSFCNKRSSQFGTSPPGQIVDSCPPTLVHNWVHAAHRDSGERLWKSSPQAHFDRLQTLPSACFGVHESPRCHHSTAGHSAAQFKVQNGLLQEGNCALFVSHSPRSHGATNPFAAPSSPASISPEASITLQPCQRPLSPRHGYPPLISTLSATPGTSTAESQDLELMRLCKPSSVVACIGIDTEPHAIEALQGSLLTDWQATLSTSAPNKAEESPYPVCLLSSTTFKALGEHANQIIPRARQLCQLLGTKARGCCASPLQPQPRMVPCADQAIASLQSEAAQSVSLAPCKPVPVASQSSGSVTVSNTIKSKHPQDQHIQQTQAPKTRGTTGKDANGYRPGTSLRSVLLAATLGYSSTLSPLRDSGAMPLPSISIAKDKATLQHLAGCKSARMLNPGLATPSPKLERKESLLGSLSDTSLRGSLADSPDPSLPFSLYMGMSLTHSQHAERVRTTEAADSPDFGSIESVCWAPGDALLGHHKPVGRGTRRFSTQDSTAAQPRQSCRGTAPLNSQPGRRRQTQQDKSRLPDVHQHEVQTSNACQSACLSGFKAAAGQKGQGRGSVGAQEGSSDDTCNREAAQLRQLCGDAATMATMGIPLHAASTTSRTQKRILGSQSPGKYEPGTQVQYPHRGSWFCRLRAFVCIMLPCNLRTQWMPYIVYIYLRLDI
jgi:hypothetical protein